MQRISNARTTGWKLVLVMAGLAFALAATSPARAAAPTVPPQPAAPGTTAEVVLRALSFLGVRYKLGGNSPETGLDCSGLVRNVFQDVVGMVLPRRAVEMSHAGEAIASTAQLKPGDLVFFRTIRKAVSHVGIYIGNNEFVHAPSRHGSVRVDSMAESYWHRRFVSARRMFLPRHDAADTVSSPANGSTASITHTAATDTATWPGYLDFPPEAAGALHPH